MSMERPKRDICVTIHNKSVIIVRSSICERDVMVITNSIQLSTNKKIYDLRRYKNFVV